MSRPFRSNKAALLLYNCSPCTALPRWQAIRSDKAACGLAVALRMPALPWLLAICLFDAVPGAAFRLHCCACLPTCRYSEVENYNFNSPVRPNIFWVVTSAWLYVVCIAYNYNSPVMAYSPVRPGTCSA